MEQQPSSLQLLSLVALNDASKTAIDIVNHYKSIDPPRDNDDDNDDDDAPTNDGNPWRNVEAIGAEIEAARSGLGDAWRDARAHLVHEMEDDNDDDDDNDIENYSKDGFRPSNNIDSTRTIDLDMEANMDDGLNGNESGGDGEEKDDDSSDTNNSSTPGTTDDGFRAQYMNTMTETFGDALEQMHQQGDVDVDVLVECLQSGIDFLEPHEIVKTHETSLSFFDSLKGSSSDANGKGGNDGDVAMDGNNGNDNDNNNDNDGGATVHERRQRKLGYLVVPINGGDTE